MNPTHNNNPFFSRRTPASQFLPRGLGEIGNPARLTAILNVISEQPPRSDPINPPRISAFSSSSSASSCEASSSPEHTEAASSPVERTLTSSLSALEEHYLQDVLPPVASSLLEAKEEDSPLFVPSYKEESLDIIKQLQSCSKEEFFRLFHNLDSVCKKFLYEAVENLYHTSDIPDFGMKILSAKGSESLKQPAPSLLHHRGNSLLEQLQHCIEEDIAFTKGNLTAESYKNSLLERFKALVKTGLLRHQKLKILYNRLPFSIQQKAPQPPFYHSGLRKDLHKEFGSHTVGENISFKVYAPNAVNIDLKVANQSIDKQDFTYIPMTKSSDGTFYLSKREMDIPCVDGKIIYQYAITNKGGHIINKADPFCLDNVEFFKQLSREEINQHYSVVKASTYTWTDVENQYVAERQFNRDYPLNIYEMHPGIWKKKDSGESLNWRELAAPLADYLIKHNFNAVELFGLFSHPLDKSWGYQVSGMFSFNHRMGSSEDFKYLVETLHARGIKVIADIVLAHFAEDSFGLEHFDGDNLYELEKKSEWGTPLFNIEKQWVRDFMASSITYLIEDCHIDGFRFDAVSEMLLDSHGASSLQKPDETKKPYKKWANRLLRPEGKKLIRELNALIHSYNGTFSIAEESAGFPGLTESIHAISANVDTKKISKRGLGFDMAWNLAHKHYILKEYFRQEHKSFDKLLTGLKQNQDRHLVHGASHDDTGNGNQSLRGGMHGTTWEKFAQARVAQALFTCLPGSTLTMMGCELAQETEWSAQFSSLALDAVDWKSLETPRWNVEVSKGSQKDYPNLCECMQITVARLGELKLNHPAFCSENPSDNFTILHDTDHQNHILAFRRSSLDRQKSVMCVFNFKNQEFNEYFIPLQDAQSRSLAKIHLLFNSDAKELGGNTTSATLSYNAHKCENGNTGVLIRIPAHSCLIFEETFK